ncbi:MAG TPA: helix-turn-helix domain-containing protein [Ktedonobacteraceae bacterium]|nr:helix-turn-helix domain-containing protein [Ktedonobacteraceae bacterium]
MKFYDFFKNCQKFLDFNKMNIVLYLHTDEGRDTDLEQKILNTKGAAARLGCTENWIHKLVYSGRLKAYMYDETGTLVEREPGTSRQGQGLYFNEADIVAYQQFQRRGKGRPAGSKSRKQREGKQEHQEAA